jgi:hypothetical protein
MPLVSEEHKKYSEENQKKFGIKYKQIMKELVMKKIEEVEIFINEFFQKENDLTKDRKNLIGTRDENEKRVFSFFKEFGIATMLNHFNDLLAWPDNESEDKREKYLKNILRIRILFVIEEYIKPIFDQSVLDQGIKSDQMFACYVSDKSRIANNYYFKRIIVGESKDNKFKIIQVQSEDNSVKDALAWKEYHIEGECPDVKELGELLNKKKYQTPEDDLHLKHYNSQVI